MSTEAEEMVADLGEIDTTSEESALSEKVEHPLTKQIDPPKKERTVSIRKIATPGIKKLLKDYYPKDFDYSITPEQAKDVKKSLMRYVTGLQSGIPLFCKAQACPYKSSCVLYKNKIAPIGHFCHLPGTLIKTSKNGDIPIEQLDNTKHRLVGYDRRRNAFRGEGLKKGYNFSVHHREYHGNIFKILTATYKKHNITFDHISLTRFNKNALNKFCVYLMKRGKYFRIGKSQLLKEHNGKKHMPFSQRLYHEDADALWILGIYNTNAEALLAEDYYSCTFQASKTLFIADKEVTIKDRVKNSGLYKWVTQKELDEHHMKFHKPLYYWSEKLSSLGLSLLYPFIDKYNTNKTCNDIKVFATYPMFIRACNIIPEIMDVPTVPKKKIIEKDKHHLYSVAKWEQINIVKYYKYNGIVYSLEVDKFKTYIADGIVTHNCPMEQLFVDTQIKFYMDELEIDWENSVIERTQVLRMIEVDIMHMRANNYLGMQDWLHDHVVGVNEDGKPITTPAIHPAWELKERCQNIKSRILKELVATRESKAKVYDHKDASPDITAAQRSKKAKAILAEVKEI